jgi:Tfp pilus assembly protein PilF
MDLSDERIDGWKSIAAYLGRDRSTVIRWANERRLPVHSLPGGRRRTVYATRGELDAWLLDGGSNLDTHVGSTQFAAGHASPEASTSEPAVTLVPSTFDAGPTAPPILPSSDGKPTLRMLLAGAAMLLIVLLIVGWPLMPTDRKGDATLDPQTEAQLLRARDQVASRSTVDLDAALTTLRAIATRNPRNAEAQATLAEAYILAREFGSLSDGYALVAARRSALSAQRLDRKSAKALRVLGLIEYWSDHEPVAAGRSFRRAIALDPTDALAHQWYGNILVDNGEQEAAMREFQIARRLNPGAAFLLADYAWGLWSVGSTGQGEALLTNVARVSPDMASVHDGLSVMAFARNDLPGYARHLRKRALVRQSPELVTYSRLIDTVLASSSGRRALYDAMLGRALAQAEGAPAADLSWAAFVASVFGDRAELVSILRLSASRGERWGAAGFTRRIAERWKNDAAVQAALATLRQPEVEPDT